MTEQPPEHPKLTPEEAARMFAEKEGLPIEGRPVENVAAGIRRHIEEFGPNETEIGGVTYTVWIEDEDEGEEPGGDDPDLLIRFVERLFEREPRLRQHFASAVTLELTEELMRRGSATCAKRVTEIQQSWEQDA